MLGETRLLDQKQDARGRVFEVLRREHLVADKFGQIYVFTAAPGAVKGNHYHNRKTEWFCVLIGDGELILLDRDSGQRESIIMSGNRPTVVEIPAGIVHAMVNLGSGELVVLAYITEPYDPMDSDTFPFRALP